MDILSEFINWVSNNLVQSILFTLIGIIASILLSIIYNKSKKPCKYIKSHNLLKACVSNYDDLAISYNNERVKNLTVSNIKFWNEGKATINRSDIAEADPIIIQVSNDNKILNATILKETDTRNRFKLVILDEKNIQIDFDYIDKNDGILIQVLHTGLSSKDIDLKGKVKEVKQIANKSGIKDFPVNILSTPTGKTWLSKNFRKIMASICIAMPLLMIAITVAIPQSKHLPNESLINDTLSNATLTNAIMTNLTLANEHQSIFGTSFSDLILYTFIFVVVILMWGMAISLLINVGPKELYINEDEFDDY